MKSTGWRAFLAGLLLVALCLSSNAGKTTFAYAQPTTQPVKGGSVTFGLVMEPNSLVALTTVVDPTIIVSTKIHDGLISLDKDGKPRPCLATAWNVSGDGRTVTFTLRRGVKWHDGKEFTSTDVAFSLTALKKYNPRGKTSLAALERVETPDPHTAIVYLKNPVPYLLGYAVRL